MRKPITTAILAALFGGVLPCVADAGTSADTLQFSAHPFDTQRDTLSAPPFFSLQAAVANSLQLIQFSGPIEQQWLDELSARGIHPIHYVASNGYVVWVDGPALSQLESLRANASWLQYAAPFQGFLKVDSNLGHRLAANPGADDEVDVVVQVYAHDGVDATKRFVAATGIVPTAQRAPLGSGVARYDWAPILEFENLALRVRLSDIPAIAERPDVTYVGERLARTMQDEKQGIILSGDLAPGPAKPSYLQFLLDHGFSQSAADYPVVDVTDSTIDEGGTGVTAMNTSDNLLHVLGDPAQPSRIAYFRNCSTLPDTSVGSIDGHGSLNAGIIGDYDQRSGYPFRDTDGQQLGLGINPFGRVGSTTIFVPGYDIGGCAGTDQGVILANWQNGAKISSNSWGAGNNGSYDDAAQAYDAGVRDADPGSSGNQQMIYVFAAGNSGPGTSTIGTPGTAKNVITVGASENLRPFPTPSDNICGPDPASNPENVVGFSGRGPVAGGRTKPEVLAPGTHIQAGASVYSGYNGSETCVKYYPEVPEQHVFTYSSGTSHSTPATSGVASLAYWWIEHGGAGDAAGSVDEVGGHREPSPALMKAWLIAHPTYLDGVSANDNLPSNNQGYGMPNMGDMFSATPKVVLDQSDIFDNTGETRSYTWGIVDSTRPLRIAMSYTDAPGMAGASPQVNDLDLRVEVNGETYFGNHFDHQWSTPGGSADDANNYEAVFLPPGIVGDVTITIVATNIAGDGVPGSGDATDQDFALVCSNCSRSPSFALSAAASALQVCAGEEQEMSVHLTQVLGFADPVTLSASGNPLDTTVVFDPAITPAPADSVLTLSAQASASPGTYPLAINAVSGSIAKSLGIDLGIYNVVPAAPANASPASGATDVPATPTFSWNPASDAYAYRVEIATDPAFIHVVRAHETTATAWTVGTGEALDTSARYWWRVIARNPCGDSSEVADGDTLFANGFEATGAIAGNEFTTQTLPGDCPVDVSATIVFSDDMETGGDGWTHGAANGNIDNWVWGTVANSGSRAFQATAPAAGAPNDQWLVSRTIVLPADLAVLSLKFWNLQDLKSGGVGVCNDAAIVEASSNDGNTWTQLTGVLTDPYDGVASGAFGNPLGSRQSWCGDPQPYLNSVVDVQAYAGQAVKFRFRLGHDRFPHRVGVNWAVDDVKVTGCSP